MALELVKYIWCLTRNSEILVYLILKKIDILKKKRSRDILLYGRYGVELSRDEIMLKK